MKTKFNVEIHKSGSLNDHILRMVANHNEGKATVTIAHFEWLVKLQLAIYPTISKGYNFESNGRTVEISEDDNQTKTITIEEIKVPEPIQQEETQESFLS